MPAIDQPPRSAAKRRQARARPGRPQVGGSPGEARDQRDFVSAILDAVGAIVIVVDAQGRLARYNAAASLVSGYSNAEIDAHGSFDFLVPLEQRQEVLEVLGELEPGGEVNRRDNEWVRKDGTRRHIAWANTAVFDREGRMRYTIATGIDITDRKNLEVELAHLSLHDALTGLPNRRLLLDRLEHVLQSRRRVESSVLFLDVDDFKVINDQLGHDVGDEVLKVVAERLTKVIRPGDTIARLSGDEFAVVLEDATDGNAPNLVATRLLEAVAHPIDVHDRRLSLTLSIGIALASSTLSADDLLRNADFAMYRAKSAGGAQYRRYAFEDRAAVDDATRLEAELSGAVARGELRLHYQPVVDLGSGRITGVEALVRWQHPQRGLLGPDRFIPIAERTGSIIEIGEWVLASACAALRTLHAAYPGLSMAVNLSGSQLASPRLYDHVRRALRQNAIVPATLILEVTESVLVANPAAVAKLAQLKTLGLRLAIDDFGTGYSALSYLRRISLDILKVDREFTQGVDSPDGLKLVRGIVQLGLLIGLDLIAEGIERPEQIGPLLQAGCQEGQGFLFSRPVDGEELSALLQRGSLGPIAGKAASRVLVAAPGVKNHMTNILRKLAVNDRTHAVVFAMRQGWIRMSDT
jgi:diguanylate cyclase (GGDEF)-like protein/PAS domain S-box-containing protein